MDYPFASHHEGPRFKSPGGVLMWTVILLLALSRYIGDPMWCDHWLHCPSVGASLGSAPTMCKPAASSPFRGCFTRLRGNNLWADLILHSSSVPVSHLLQVLLPASQLTESASGGSPLESLQSHFTSFTPCLTGPVDYLFASRHEGPGFKSPGGTSVKLGF